MSWLATFYIVAMVVLGLHTINVTMTLWEIDKLMAVANACWLFIAAMYYLVVLGYLPPGVN